MVLSLRGSQTQCVHVRRARPCVDKHDVGHHCGATSAAHQEGGSLLVHAFTSTSQ